MEVRFCSTTGPRSRKAQSDSLRSACLRLSTTDKMMKQGLGTAGRQIQRRQNDLGLGHGKCRPDTDAWAGSERQECSDAGPRRRLVRKAVGHECCRIVPESAMTMHDPWADPYLRSGSDELACNNIIDNCLTGNLGDRWIQPQGLEQGLT